MSASRAPSPPTCGPATLPADTVSGCLDPLRQHGRLCRSRQSSVLQTGESGPERSDWRHWQGHTPRLPPTPTGSAADKVFPRQSNDDWTGLCGRPAAETWPRQILLVNLSLDPRSPGLFTAKCYRNNLCSKKCYESSKTGTTTQEVRRLFSKTRGSRRCTAGSCTS